ncbi:MAG: gntK [Planctomycetaceae bacterium]|nr:gntK [Planctomycetaceae bacterium]
MTNDEIRMTKECRMTQSGTVVVLVGPSGCGKTVVGKQLAAELHAAFLDADDFHTPEAKALMHAGHPLNDEQRHPWLERVRRAAVDASTKSLVILACSALKPELRHFLGEGNAIWKFLALQVEAAILHNRLAQRQGHFFPASMLDSQLADWHPLSPDEGFAVDGSQSIAAVVTEIRTRLDLNPVN